MTNTENRQQLIVNLHRELKKAEANAAVSHFQIHHVLSCFSPVDAAVVTEDWSTVEASTPDYSTQCIDVIISLPIEHSHKRGRLRQYLHTKYGDIIRSITIRPYE